MAKLQEAKYLGRPRARFDRLSLVLSVVSLGVAFLVVGHEDAGELSHLYDLRSIMIVGVGTMALCLLQFDLLTVQSCLGLVLGTLRGTPDRQLRDTHAILDQAILQEQDLTALAPEVPYGQDLLRDVVVMQERGLLFEEIDELITGHVRDRLDQRQHAIDLLQRGAVIAPALGLFGTVLGLIGVLKSLQDPATIGQSMSLALMTTAYGAGLGTFVFTPLAGRLEHHTGLLLESYQQVLSKIRVVMLRQERTEDQFDETA